MFTYIAKFLKELSGLQIFSLFMAGVLFVLFVAVMLSGGTLSFAEIMRPGGVASAFQKLFGINSSKKEILEFLGWGIGGFVVLYGLGAYDKRANAQFEQNKLQIEQNNLTKAGLFQEQLRAAIDHLSGLSESGRIAAFHEFFHLAKANADYAQSILDILCAHLRKILGDAGEGAPLSQEIKSLAGELLFKKDTAEPFAGLFYNLQGANLSILDFRNMYIPSGYIDLRGANLAGINFRLAELQNADLRDADLRGADLRDASLRRADLRGADLRGADLRGADLREAGFLGAKYDDQTQFPEGFDPSAAGMVKSKGE